MSYNKARLKARITEMHTITYYANNDSMGDTSEQACDKFREWAERELKREYPEYEIKVTDEQSTGTVHTSDEDNRDSILDFCSRLWDNCPWDWASE